MAILRSAHFSGAKADCQLRRQSRTGHLQLLSLDRDSPTADCHDAIPAHARCATEAIVDCYYDEPAITGAMSMNLFPIGHLCTR